MSKKNTFAMAMEDIEEGEAAAAGITDVELVPAEVHQEVDEVVGQAEQSQVVETELVDAVDSTNELEEFGATVQSSVETPAATEGGAATPGEGMTPETAEVVEMAVESLRRRLNIKKGVKIGSESFGADRTRLSASKMAVESISESVKKAWEAIKAFFAKIGAWIVNFFKSVFTSTGRLKASAEKIVEKAKAATGEAEKTIKAGSYVNKLTIGGKFDAKIAVAGVSEIPDFFTKAIKAVEEIADQAGKAIGSLKSAKGEPGEVNMTSLMGMLTNKKRAGSDFVADTGELPGNNAFKLIIPETGTLTDKVTFGLFTNAKFSMATYDEKQVAFKAEVVETASAEQVGKIAQGVLAIVAQIEKNKDLEAKLTKTVKDTLVFVDAVIKTSTVDKEGAASNATVRKGVSRIGSLVGTMPATITGYSIGTSKAYLQYAAASLAAHKAPAKAA